VQGNLAALRISAVKQVKTKAGSSLARNGRKKGGSKVRKPGRSEGEGNATAKAKGGQMQSAKEKNTGFFAALRMTVFKGGAFRMTVLYGWGRG